MEQVTHEVQPGRQVNAFLLLVPEQDTGKLFRNIWILGPAYNIIVVAFRDDISASDDLTVLIELMTPANRNRCVDTPSVDLWDGVMDFPSYLLGLVHLFRDRLVVHGDELPGYLDGFFDVRVDGCFQQTNLL